MCTFMFIAALFTVAKIWKHPKCLSVDEWILKKLGTLTQWNTTRPKKEGNLTFYDIMDRPGEYYAKWNKPVREERIPYEFIYVCNPMNKIN